NVEGLPVVARWILVRHVGWLGGKRELDVGVDGAAIAALTFQDPVGRNRDLIPAGIIQAFVGDSIYLLACGQHSPATWRSGSTGQQTESPQAVERDRGSVTPQPGTGRQPSARAGATIGDVGSAGK